MLPPIIQKASLEIQKLPGVGRRGAGKMALDILNLNQEQFNHFQSSIVRMRNEVFFCPNCGFFADSSVNSIGNSDNQNKKVFNNYLQDFLPFFAKDLCSICANPERNPYQICVVEKATDILNIEKSQIYHGFYHVLSKLISPLDRVFAEDTTLFSLFERIDSLLNFDQKNNKNTKYLGLEEKVGSTNLEIKNNLHNTDLDLQIKKHQDNANKSQIPNQIELILFFKTGFSAEATTAYIREKIEQESLQNYVRLTKLAEGLPLYYNPDNLDQATMIKALEDRKNIF